MASVLGIVYIPGMMTGAILGGSSVEQAARLQIVIMFMISAATALSAIVSTVLTLSVVVDTEDRIRLEKIDNRLHVVWRTSDLITDASIRRMKSGWRSIAVKFGGERRHEDDTTSSETERLLG